MSRVASTRVSGKIVPNDERRLSLVGIRTVYVAVTPALESESSASTGYELVEVKWVKSSVVDPPLFRRSVVSDATG